MAFPKRLSTEHALEVFSIHDPAFDEEESDFEAYSKTLDPKNLVPLEGEEPTPITIRPLSVSEHDTIVIDSLSGEKNIAQRGVVMALAAEKKAAIYDSEIQLPFNARAEIGSWILQLTGGHRFGAAEEEEAADDLEKS
jgi:hypothetical protein